jgi:outer membrane lipoprotein carrier protein
MTGIPAQFAPKQRSRTPATLVVVAFLLHLAAPADAQPAIVTRVLDKYASLVTLQARFQQTMTSDLFDEAESVSGVISMRGAAYRILAGSRTIVTDGETSWIYNAIENQVLIDDYYQDESTFSIHEFLYGFENRFTVQGTGRIGENWRIALSPKDPDDYFQQVELIVRESDAIITRIEIDDANEVHLSIALREIIENPELADDIFSFEVPDQADVVDLRAD